MSSNANYHNKEVLISEKNRIEKLLESMDKGKYCEEIGGEISVVDNHPADIGEEIATANTAFALRENEKDILMRIDKALSKIDSGEYGTCASCGEEISKERLDIMPHAEYCIGCQNNLSNIYDKEYSRRPVEESVLDPFNYGYNDFKDDPGFDGEDSYQAVERFNYETGIDDFYYKDEEYVEEVDRISNEYYRNQLQ